MMKSNMYALSVRQLNLHVGCKFGCIYCRSSFQKLLRRWGKSNCQLCYQYKPHTHLERMKLGLAKTRYMQFIFLCSSGDVAFCPTDALQQIMDFAKEHSDRTFLLQSKDPATFQRVKIPDNVILGTTVETNRTSFLRWRQMYPDKNYRIRKYEQISKAPHPSERVKALEAINHKTKMLTYEPILNFDCDAMIEYAERIQPCMIWLGMDSRPTINKLPEPRYSEVKQLHWELSRRGFVVILKKIRLGWWEK